MADLAVSLTVSRPTTPLELEQPGTSRVVSVGPGSMSRRREVAISPFVDGEFLISSVKDVVNIALAVRFFGATHAALKANVEAALAAFDQFSYTLTLTLEGEVSTWSCEPADYGPLDGQIDPFGMRSTQQVYTFAIPRQPTPVI